MMVTETVVGFDARETWLPNDDAGWPPSQREAYLYRTDVEKPFSIDPAVWISVFAAAGVGEPQGKFGYQDSWAELAALEAATTKLFRTRQIEHFETVAFSLLQDDISRRSRSDWSDIVPPPTPDWIGETWRLVGYDVADTWMTSALSNCGFVDGEDDVAALRRRWAGALNEHHLFVEQKEAFAFRDMSDVRLKADHAPCFVFGIWIVR